MVTVEVQESVTSVTVEPTTINIVIEQSPIYVEVGPSLVTQTGTESGGITSRYRVLGSSFSGNSGDTGRSYTFPTGLGTKQIVAVGSSSGALTILDTDGYSLSTTTNTNDTLSITGELFDDEVVIVWL